MAEDGKNGAYDAKRAKVGDDAPASAEGDMSSPAPGRQAGHTHDNEEGEVNNQAELDDIFEDDDDFQLLSQTDNPHRRTPHRDSSSNSSHRHHHHYQHYRQSRSASVRGGSTTAAREQPEETIAGAPQRSTAGATAGNGDVQSSDEEELSPEEQRAQRRSIFCNIHGHIEFEPVLVDVIDTAEFQRLRGLQQLGGSSYVFPSACHTRFSHSLGVAHLAGVMVDHLRSLDDNSLDITQRDRLCVKLAGLCHDLGHGPFSHTFEMFVNRIRAANEQTPWHHEEASLKLFDKLLQANGIDLTLYDLQPPEDTQFIKRLIRGLSETEPWPTDIGRTEDKRFLFDIVANNRNGIDVDKLDYFMRDSVSALGDPPIVCDVRRLIKSSRVCSVNGHPAICFEEKMALSILELFRLRAWLHKYVYQHHTVNLVEEMISDALTDANGAFPNLRGADGKTIRSISDAVDDMDAFSRLGDWILQAIESSPDPALEKAQEILARLRKRHLYAPISHPVELVTRVSESTVRKEVLRLVADNCDKKEAAKALVVHVASIDYGARSRDGTPINPLGRVHFFNPKVDNTLAYSIDAKKFPPLFMPQTFGQRLLYVYSRSDEMHPFLEVAFHRWKRAYADAAKSKGGGPRAPLLTPVGNGNPQSPQHARHRLQRHNSRPKPVPFQNKP